MHHKKVPFSSFYLYSHTLNTVFWIIQQINSLRTAINMALQSEAEVAGWGTPAVERIQNSSRRTITEYVFVIMMIKNGNKWESVAHPQSGSSSTVSRLNWSF